MATHRTTRARVSNPPTTYNPEPELPDVDDTLHATRDALWRADACITAAQRMIEEPGGGGSERSDDDEEPDEESYGYGGDDDVGRRRNHLLEHIEATKEAVRAAQYAHNRTIARLEGHRGKP